MAARRRQQDLWAHSSGHTYQKLRKEFKARCQAANLPCHLCNGDLGPIDYTAPGNQSNAFEVDHFHPISVRPDLRYELSNWRPAHCSCNRSRQAKAIKEQHYMQHTPSSSATGAWVRPSW